MRRTLEQAARAAGHTCVKDVAHATLAMVDQVHPTPERPAKHAPTLTLTREQSPSATNHLLCPVHPSLLIQRLTVRPQAQALVLAQEWELDLQARALIHPAQPRVSLTEKECLLLQRLVQGAPAPMSRETLLEEVWGMENTIDTHTLETHIYRIRTKLEMLTPSPGTITTEGGTYRYRY